MQRSAVSCNVTLTRKLHLQLYSYSCMCYCSRYYLDTVSIQQSAYTELPHNLSTYRCKHVPVAALLARISTMWRVGHGRRRMRVSSRTAVQYHHRPCALTRCLHANRSMQYVACVFSEFIFHRPGPKLDRSKHLSRSSTSKIRL